jgi:hypothetical protein
LLKKLEKIGKNYQTFETTKLKKKKHPDLATYVSFHDMVVIVK